MTAVTSSRRRPQLPEITTAFWGICCSFADSDAGKDEIFRELLNYSQAVRATKDL